MVTLFLFTQPIEEGGKVWCCVDLVLDIVYFTWNQHHSGVLRQTSWPAGQAVQWYSGISIVSIDVSCSILGIIYDIIEISDISNKLITFAIFCIDFSEISDKASFVWMFKCTNLLDPLHESAVIGQSTYEYDLDNFMNEPQLCQIFQMLHMDCKTCAFNWTKLRVSGYASLVFMTEWSCQQSQNLNLCVVVQNTSCM